MRIASLVITWILLGLNVIPNAATAEYTCWSEPLDLSTLLIRSDIVAEYDLEMEVANDFVMESGPAELVLARWWGGYAEQAGYSVETFNLRFYAEDPTNPCLPGPLSAEFIIVGNANEAFVDYNSLGFPIYRYEAALSFEALAGIRYWFVCQAGNHPVPPDLWGRNGTSEVTGCVSAFRSEYFGYPDWADVSEIAGGPWDASQEFLCESPTVIAPASWGRMRSLFR